jgi:hypothetical protein
MEKALLGAGPLGKHACLSGAVRARPFLFHAPCANSLSVHNLDIDLWFTSNHQYSIRYRGLTAYHGGMLVDMGTLALADLNFSVR